MTAARAEPMPRTGATSSALRRSMAHLAAGAVGGFISGFVIGGIGSRLAMFILRLTSDPSLHGRETDDGFIIGSFTSDSFFLIGIATFAGIAGALFYLAIRPWIPERLRAPAMGVYGAVVGGAGILRPDGIDFTELDPILLAVVMFIALPGLYGVAMVWLTERFLRREPRDSGRVAWAFPVLGLLPLVMGGPFSIGLILGLGILWFLNVQLGGALTNVWRSTAVTWLGRLVLLGLTAWAFVILVDDTFTIL